MVRRMVFLLLLFSVAVRAASAETEADLAKKVQTALASTYYQGLLLTSRKVGNGREEEVAKAWFGPKGRQALEIVSPAWRQGERFVADAAGSWLYYPDCGAALRLSVGGKHPLPMAKGAVYEGVDRVGTRQAHILRWNNQRGSRRIWVDAERFVPIKREDRNARGELLLSQILTDVQFPEAPPLAELTFVPEARMAVYEDEAAFQQAVSLPHVQRGVDYRLRTPEYLPAGLVFRRAILRSLPQIIVVQMRYSDGKDKAFSLFQYRPLQMPVQPEKRFLAELGGRDGRGKLNFIRWKLGELEFVLIGNLPPETLREISRSVK